MSSQSGNLSIWRKSIVCASTECRRPSRHGFCRSAFITVVAIAAVEVPRAFLPALSVSSRPMARSSPQVAALDRVFADERVQELLRADWMAGIPEDRVPPGNRWCKRCDGGPRWCCLCPCHGCGLRECNCSCGVGDYELHPFLASWDSPWHTTGYRRDFVQGVRDLTEALRSIVD